jgi:hypothetical protein
MSRPRIALGIFVGALIVASSLAHSLLGWRDFGARLVATQAPDDLITGLKIGWHFAGVAMFTFGTVVIWTFENYLRGRPVSLRPAQIIGLVYLTFGLWALAVSRFDPFFFIFIVPGLTLVAVAWWPTTVPIRRQI